MSEIEQSGAMNDDQIGAGIVSHSREARFAEITLEQWTEGLAALITAKEGVEGGVDISDLRQVGEAAGGSNGTLLFDASYTGANGRVEGSFVLRFLPAEGLFHEYKLDAQYDLQAALESSVVPVPAQRWLDNEGSYLPRPGYVMEQVPGVSTPMVWKVSGLIAEASVAARREMTLELVHAIAKIHQVDWRSGGLSWLERRASGSMPIEREVNWYWDALIWSENQEYKAQLEPVKQWLIANEPKDAETVLCHGDCNFGNYMFDNNKVSAVIDWEMSFLGSPESDLTFLVAGNEVLGADLPWPEGAISFDEMFAEYERVSGRKLVNLDYYYLFSSYRLAVINVLAMKHFPPEALAAFMPTLKRGPKLCLARAEALGVASA